jgi:uncharacterized protein
MLAGTEWLVLVVIGLAAGIASGVFGIGGGVLIVPALVYLLKFSYSRAIGTSLAVLLPPVGAAAVWSYYRASMVDMRAAIVLAVMLFAGAWLGAQLVQRLDAASVRVLFGLFLIVLGVYTVWSGRG